VFAFEDINPQAPTHILLCPKKHFAALHDAEPGDQALLGKLQMVAAKLAKELRLLSGYRTVFNNGAGAGQSVFICTCTSSAAAISVGLRAKYCWPRPGPGRL